MLTPRLGWQHPIQPIGAEDKGEDYDVLEAIQDEPVSPLRRRLRPPTPVLTTLPPQITNYGVVGAWEPLSDPRIRTDPRCRIVLHINWKAQTLPIIIGGLLSKAKASGTPPRDWNALPQPPVSEVRRASPLAQIAAGNYATPTFLVHGTADDLIPWEQSRRTHEELVARGVRAGLALVEGAPHICDLSSDVESEGWKATVRGYEFLCSHVL